MNHNYRVAAAVAAILGTGAGAANATPTLAQAQAAPVTLNIAGSSAAKNAVLGVLQTEMCGGATNALTFNSVGNTNFNAVSCFPVNGFGGSDGSSVYTVYYRAEGGSVVGMLPIVNNDQVETLNISDGSVTCGANTCTATITGVSTGNGTNDSFGGAVTLGYVQLGIADVEPAALVGNNYPTAYNTATWGPKNESGLAGLTATKLFDEVYAVFVNTSSGFTSTGPLSLSKQMVEQIFQRTSNATNWSTVTDTSGNPVATASLPIQIVNRESGSGSRAATDLLIMGDSCQTQGKKLVESKNTNTDYFSTGDVLTNAGSVAGAITYATIDQSKANLTQVALNGVTPGNFAAATGQYDFWVEATGVVNTGTGAATGASLNLANALVTAFQTEATTAHLPDVLAIPGTINTASKTITSTASNVAGTTRAGLGTFTIYVNPFSRNGVTCNLPTYSATT